MDLQERIGRDQATLNRLGILVDGVADRAPLLRMPVAADMLNAGEVCHGGLLFALADTAAAYALAEAGVTPLTVDAGITYLRGVRLNDEVSARAEVVRAGRKIGHCEVRLMLGDGTLAAVYRATCANA